MTRRPPEIDRILRWSNRRAREEDLELVAREPAIDGALAQIVGDKYQVPVVPLAQLQGLMHGLGDFAPTFPGTEGVDLGREIRTIRV